ncbi:MAG: signal peptidase I [Elusimicrobia bacterium]|nr:signal peptidase I [Elusimicrobiota bacterium]
MALVSLVFWLIIVFEAILSAKRISNNYVLKRFNRWYIYIIIIVIIQLVDISVEAVIVRNTIFKAFKVPAGSMMPTIYVGDHFICDLSYYHLNNPARGDIIIFKWPVNESIFYIKRIIGAPGDTIQIIDDDLYINNEKTELDYIGKYVGDDGKGSEIYKETYGNSSYQILEQIKKHENYGPVKIPEGEYFVMGDNRDNSNDSRYWGMVKRHQIYGRPVFIYFSWDIKIPAWKIISRLTSIRFSRIGDILE